MSARACYHTFLSKFNGQNSKKQKYEMTNHIIIIIIKVIILQTNLQRLLQWERTKKERDEPGMYDDRQDHTHRFQMLRYLWEIGSEKEVKYLQVH